MIMAKINYQCTNWGGEEGKLHFELDIDDTCVMIDVGDEGIRLTGNIDECYQVGNAVNITYINFHKRYKSKKSKFTNERYLG